MAVNDRPSWNQVNANGLDSDPLPRDTLSRHNAQSSAIRQTVRTRLQNQRSQINEKISKERRLLDGAEKLLKANPSNKSRIVLERQFLESNLQLLKDELADDVLLEHYGENLEQHTAAVDDLNLLRKSALTPPRDDSGIQLLFQYLNNLYYIDKRFFRPGKGLKLNFEWFDTFTGCNYAQKSIAFEKASILYNIAALYSQLAVAEMGSHGCSRSIAYFCKSAGVLQHISDNFSHAPSADLRWETLSTLTNLMLAQSQECVFNLMVAKRLENSREDLKGAFELGEEAAQTVVMMTNFLHMLTPQLETYLPRAWIDLVKLKRDFYDSFAHYYTACGISSMRNSHSLEMRSMFRNHFVQRTDPTHSSSNTLPHCATKYNNSNPPESQLERRLLARVHIREAKSTFDDCLCVLNLSSSLSRVKMLRQFCQEAGFRIEQKSLELEMDEDFVDFYLSDKIQPRTSFKSTPTKPDFKEHRMVDLFESLGPIHTFNARQKWTAPRKVDLIKSSRSPGFGFSISGDCPVVMAAVDRGGLAEQAGVRPGDFIVAIGTVDTKWSKHEEIVRLIRGAGHELTVFLCSPIKSESLSSGYGSSESSTLSSDKAATVHRSSASSLLRRASGNWGFSSKSKGSSGRSRRLTASSISLRSLFFAKRKFRSEPDLKNPDIFLR